MPTTKDPDMNAVEQRVEALTLTVSVEQGKVAYRDKLIAAAEAREQALQQRVMLAEALNDAATLQQRVEELEAQIEAKPLWPSRIYAGPEKTMSDPYADAGMDNPPEPVVAEIEVLRMQLGLTLDRAKEAEARERVLQQRVGELERGLKVERLALEISGRQSETLEAREQALQKRVEELEELYKLARAEISRLGRQTIDAIAKQNAAEARERELREALQQIVNECSTFPIKPGLAFRCGSIAHAALSTHKEKTS